MNYIEKLLKGAKVEWKKLGEVVQLEKGKQLNKTLLSENGLYPAYNGGVSFSGFTNLYNYDENTIIISQGGASAGFVNFITTKFYANAHCYVILPNIKKVENRYIFHFLKQNQDNLMNKQHGAGIPALKTNEVLNLLIPIPPISVQKEIVKILDTFTTLTAELTAELTARKKQYDYYREHLLTFKEGEAEWKQLGEIFDIIAGGDAPRNALSNLETEEFSIPVLSNGIDGKSLYGWTNIAKIEKPSLTISARGTIGWTSYQDKPFFPIVRLLVLTPKIEINIKYSYYYMKLIENNYKVPATGIPQLTKPMVKDVLIPIPPLSEQERIVNILDKFDTLVNSISEGLPREIELRRKQYEYYREMLLTFPK